MAPEKTRELSSLEIGIPQSHADEQREPFGFRNRLKVIKVMMRRGPGVWSVEYKMGRVWSDFAASFMNGGQANEVYGRHPAF